MFYGFFSKSCLLIAVFLAFAAGRAESQRITEIMYDPGLYPDYELEWLELLNDTDVSVDMSGWTLCGKEINATLAPAEAAVFARNIAEGDECFESLYGDGSGVWGDAESEDYALYETPVSLLNGGDTVILADFGGNAVHSIIYAPDDGGAGNDHTLRFFSDGTVAESDALYGTPGRAEHMITLQFSEGSPKTVFVTREGYEPYEGHCALEWRGYGYGDGTWHIRVDNFSQTVFEEDLFLSGGDAEIAVDTPVVDTVPLIIDLCDEAGLAVKDVMILLKTGDYTVFEGIYYPESPPDIYPGTYGLTCYASGFLAAGAVFEASGEPLSVTLFPPGSITISEFAYEGAPEWVELAFLGSGTALLDGISLGDSLTAADVPAGVAISGRVVLTASLTALQEKYGAVNGAEIPGMPVLNDGGDTLNLYYKGEVVESFLYDDSWSRDEAFESLEKIKLPDPPCRENFYPAFRASPGARNAAEDYLNSGRSIIITEVYPFSVNEYAELCVADDGNGGRGALFDDFIITDMDDELPLSEGIVNTGDLISIRGVSLYDYGDQLLLKQGETVVDGMAYRERYANLTEEERADMAAYAELGLPLVIFDERDETLSFNRQADGTWALGGVTDQEGDFSSPVPAFTVSGQCEKAMGRLTVGCVCPAGTDIVFSVYDEGGFEVSVFKLMVYGDTGFEVPLNLSRGMYIYVIKAVCGGSKFRYDGLFTVI